MDYVESQSLSEIRDVVAELYVAVGGWREATYYGFDKQTDLLSRMRSVYNELAGNVPGLLQCRELEWRDLYLGDG